ncbi:MAG: hypothetical protein CR994_08100 [Maribacter sp.]|nr:MAG: hypothetical protein CR994_08100 [Maribacter sp.]
MTLALGEGGFGQYPLYFNNHKHTKTPPYKVVFSVFVGLSWLEWEVVVVGNLPWISRRTHKREIWF